jgi:hypothetical protein
MSRRLVSAFGLAVAAAAIAVVQVGFLVDESSILHSVSDVFLQTPPPPPLLSMEGGLNIVDDPPSICCEDFVAGARIVFLIVMFGGLPAAAVATWLAIRSWRFDRRLSHHYRTFVQAGWTLQLANLGLMSLLIGVVATTFDIGLWVREPTMLFLAFNAVVSAAALLAWRTVGGAVLSIEALGLKPPR